MTLAPGTRLGPYEVLAPLGAGGMGEVYRARDTRLNRPVAIKALHALFASHPERLARFEREAQLLASLNHPNIAAIHGLEEAQGSKFLVLEFVDGRALSDLIAAGALQPSEAIAIARQIADALATAHERGIIHRDLKPGNVMITTDGQVKVLDFGLGKALESENPSTVSGGAANSPTMTLAATQAGIILGTAGYMSPEQAKGRAADKRSDVWAFGCVLFELLTGQRAFQGEDVTDTLAAIVRGEPDWASFPAAVPPSIRTLVERCLVKDRSQRLSDMSVVRFLLSEPSTIGSTPAAALPSAPRSPVASRTVLAAGAALASVLVTFGVMRWLSPPSATQALAHVSLMLPEGHEVSDLNLLPLAMSPDGTRVAFVAAHEGVNRLYLRNIDAPAPVVLSGTEGAREPFFSPDGQWIAFFAQGRLKKVAIAGMAVESITSLEGEPRGGTWATDQTIYYAPTNISTLWKVPAAGGSPTQVTQFDTARGEVSHRWPYALPDGRSLLFSTWTGPGPDERAIFVLDLVTGERHPLVPGGDTPRYLPDGYLIYARLDTLFAVPWRPGETSLGGVAPIALPETPRLENEGAADYVLSPNGVLAYVEGGQGRYGQRVVWVDRAGKTEALPLPERDYEAAWLSPDGRRAIVQIREGTMGLWMYDFARQTLTPFATTGGSNQAAAWTPDSQRVIYRGTRTGTRNLYMKSADGTGAEERLTTKPGVVHTPATVSPDGRWLVFTEFGSLWILDLMSTADGRGARPLVEGETAGSARISPDGRWLAYASQSSGRTEVYVRPFPAPGPRVQVSTNGGTEPVWSRDGREFFFVNGDDVMVAPVTVSGTLSIGTPRLLHRGRFRAGTNSIVPWDVAKDGRFLRVQQVQPDRPVTHVNLVLGWLAELRQRATVK